MHLQSTTPPSFMVVSRLFYAPDFCAPHCDRERGPKLNQAFDFSSSSPDALGKKPIAGCCGCTCVHSLAQVAISFAAGRGIDPLASTRYYLVVMSRTSEILGNADKFGY